jgi:regulator of sigma E protease
MDTFFSILKFLGTLLEVILLFNLLIIVHELGHYWAAKWRGLKVEKFQIWFGPPIWKKTINGVQWGLGSIPAGGFVALPQMAPMEAVEGKSPDGTDRKSLPPITPLDKIIVAFAGPLFSFLLAIVFAVIVWKVGRPVHTAEATTIIGFVGKDMPAQAAGIKVGDRVVSINDVPIQTFFGLTNSVISTVALSETPTLKVVVERPGVDKPLEFNITPKAANKGGAFDRGTTRKLGIGPSYLPVVGAVMEGSPAAKAGLKPGDKILSANGTPIWGGNQVDAIGAETPGQPMQLEIERPSAAPGGTPEKLTLAVAAVAPIKPEKAKDMPLTGAVWKEEFTIIHPGPVEQIKKSALTIFTTIKALVSKDSDISVKHLSGPVGIGGAFYDMLNVEHGWRLALWFAVVVNVNLALLNMMPLPILDGGHIVLAILEKIRGKVVSLRLLEWVQTGFALLLLSFMLYVTVIDVGDRTRGSGEPAEESSKIEFPPLP